MIKKEAGFLITKNAISVHTAQDSQTVELKVCTTKCWSAALRSDIFKTQGCAVFTTIRRTPVFSLALPLK